MQFIREAQNVSEHLGKQEIVCTLLAVLEGGGGGGGEGVVGTDWALQTAVQKYRWKSWM